MRLARFLILAVGSIFIPLASLPALAQTNTNHAKNESAAQATSHSEPAVLDGTLTDPSGAAIAAATVSAEPINAASQVASVQTGPDGKFSLQLAPGQYRVTISDAPFERVQREFTLAAGDSQTWDVRLELAALSSNVIVTAAAEPERATSTVSSVDVITAQDISQRQAIFLTPLLASVPGMSFSQLGPVGGSTTFFLDGGNANYTKVLIDGVPVNQPGGLVDFSDMALDGIDKIEVVHGAASALYGSDAMAGVIQIFTHRGTTRQPVVEVEGDGGTFGTGHGSGQLSGLLGSF
ncbi:MAG TPA: TonB-dependent receptor plug domain-containing protein, partial [Candidatus Acidoferrales bacterium]